MNKKVAIIGYGWVGQAMHELFPNAFIYSHNMILHDGEWGKCNDGGKAWEEKKESYKEIVNQADFAFICVPTPNLKLDENNCSTKNVKELFGEGSLDTSAIDEIIDWCEAKTIVIRSTVNPGDCDRWQGIEDKHIVFQPEYLGETPQHPLLDTTKTPFIVLGGDKEDTTAVIELYQTVYNANIKIRQTSLVEAEIIKLSENRAIAFKVAECQELYDACRSAGVDYYTIREAVYSDDPRFNLWWSFVFPDNRGFKSKCIPKDVYAWAAWAESVGYDPKITRAMLEKNKEWIDEKSA